MRIVLLDIDGLQPAFLGPFGCEWLPTPTLDRWAAAGVVFDQHFADCPDPDVQPGWRTGRHALAAGGDDLLADLRVTGAMTARVGPAQSANGWNIDLPTKRDADPLLLKPTRRAVRQAIEKLGDRENALLRIEIDALLPPWRPSAEALAETFAVGEDEEPLEPWSDPLPDQIPMKDDVMFTRLQQTYAAAVATLDASLDRLVIDCSKRGWGNDALWILTASRGFPLGEHGAVGFAAADVHEELVHLPLMMRWPNGEPAGLRISAFTQPADLGVTARELFGLKVIGEDHPWAGRSLTSLARTGDGSTRDRLATALRRGERTLIGSRSPGWYLMLDDRPDSERRLFVKPDDRWEVNDVRARNQDLAEELEGEMQLPS
jgi:arylsulfatase A-like enzyme